ncbi:ester cyclase [Streptomyces xiamenensis]|uniref:ester cyclase n=1 Tax=Streptomyces xiamenensis TaxID=408015 RepID=UPI0035DE24C1
MPDSNARRDLIETTWAAAWGRGEVDALGALLAPDYLRYGSDPQPQHLDALKSAILGTRAAFPDLTTTIDDILLDGNRAAIRWHSTGCHENPFLGVPATGRRVRVAGATFARFEGDRIGEEYVTWDPRALLTALGVFPVGQD